MYEYLEGQVAERTPARLVLDVGGIGYEIAVPLGSEFPSGGRARAWIHMVVREDSHTLCGFADRGSRDLFRLLLSVRGVGPSMAMAILSGLPRETLLDAIAGGDAPALMRIKGVGRKTAEQILLDLRDKAAIFRARAPSSAPAKRSVAFEDAVAALVSIGYSEKEARASVERAVRDVQGDDLEQLVRTALVS